MIEVTNLTKKYGSHLAVDNLSFTVKKGQIYGFLGPNGAGKSTTMNIMTGYLAATSGTVKINGHDIVKEPEEAKACIGYLPEFPPLYVDMTVKEYLKFVAQLKKVPKNEVAEQVEKVMEMTFITEMEKRLIKNLSKGYKQRVGLAQAILGFPEIIILDEPSVGLDPKQIIEIRDLIRELGKNHTIILSSHILTEISEVCDHVMIINRGKLIASDSKEGLQKLLNSGDELKMLVKGSEENVRAALSGMEEIEAVEFEDTQEQESENSDKTVKDGYVRVKLSVRKGEDIKEKIVDVLAENKMPVYEMNYSEKSLEDIFLELTGAAEAERYAEDAEESAEAEESTEAEESAQAPQETGKEEDK